MAEALQLALISGGLVIVSSIASSALTGWLTKRATLQAVERQQAHEDRRAALEERRRYRREQAKPLQELLEELGNSQMSKIFFEIIDKGFAAASEVHGQATEPALLTAQEDVADKLFRAREAGRELLTRFASTLLLIPDPEMRSLGSELVASAHAHNIHDFFEKLREVNRRLERYVFETVDKHDNN